MMENTPELLFLEEGSMSFLAGSVREFLQDAEIELGELDIRDSAYEAPEHLAPLILAGAEQLLHNSKSRVFLYDACIEQGSHLVLIGAKDDIDDLMKVTATSLVVETFYRPVNVKEIAERVKELVMEVRSRGFRKKLLVVDDSPTFLRTAMEWLEEDYNVSVCPSAFAAIKMIATAKPDLILLDYEMPVCTGAQFLEMLNSEYESERIPVIFLTSKSDAATVSEVMVLHPQGYLLKTQPKEAILQYIKEFFNKEMFKK
ncbi:MAG: response regulator [Lachnospiraceae bacterium]|nr:response regulator [Lachnospiraceae bacterium]